MSSANSDRNLLFGVLALQMDFINRDALITVMHAWVLDDPGASLSLRGSTLPPKTPAYCTGSLRTRNRS